MSKSPLRCLRAALLGLGLASCLALADAQYLAVGWEGNQSFFKLSENPVIRLTNSGIVVSDDLNSVPFSFDEIGRISLLQGEPMTTGIKNVENANLEISRNGDVFSLPPGARADVFTPSGVRVLSQVVSDSAQISVAELPKGIYILSIYIQNNGLKTLKFRK